MVDQPKVVYEYPQRTTQRRPPVVRGGAWRRVVSANFVFFAKVALGVLGACGSVASIVALFMTRDQIAEVAYLPPSSLPWLLTGIFVLTLSMLLYVIRDYFVKLNKLKRLAKRINSIASTKARTYTHLYNILPPTADIYSSAPDSPLTDLLNQIKDLFSVYTSDDCSVCIKILREDTHGQQIAKTLTRDSGSRVERAQIDRKLREYPYERNTAFKEIIHVDSRFSYFMCNNLTRLENYVNDNERWHDYYNACIVVAITPDDGPSLKNTIGFLCVDNFRGGFDKDFCVPVMLSFGKEIYQLFELFDKLTSLSVNQSAEGKKNAAS